MESRIQPDREAVSEARRDIVSSAEEVKDEMLHLLLVHSYPQRVSQDN